MRLSLLLQQYPACLPHLIWKACEMGGKWLYNCCYVEFLLLKFVQKSMFFLHVLSIGIFFEFM